MLNNAVIKTHVTDAMQWAASGTKLTYAAISAGLLLALILFRMFFKDLPGFVHSIGFSISSQPHSAGAGQAAQTKGSRVKLLMTLALPIAAGYAAYVYLPKFFPTVFPGM
jgi:hypothetical protein